MVVPLSMSLFGAYVHIPFCLQRCHYCDFATYSKDQIQANDEYVNTVCLEISLRRPLYKENRLDTLYFGGGTPSLLSVDQLDRVISSFRAAGLLIDEKTEVTIEVNPATLDEKKCEELKKIGFNRVSIGCQSFDDLHLKNCNREHNAEQTRSTIRLVKKYFDNFSLDLLFALPNQNLESVKRDLNEIISFNPPHVSPYCLTVPPHHPMSRNRPKDQDQIKMFELVIEFLRKIGLERYELSNFCRPNYESRHNNLYWTDQNYWGVGLSAHSYRSSPDFGYRFWNSKSYSTYMEQIANSVLNSDIESGFPEGQWEKLSSNEALTDFCHTHLRLAEGLHQQSVRQKFGDEAWNKVSDRLNSSVDQGLVVTSGSGFRLTENGFLLSNKVFENLLF